MNHLQSHHNHQRHPSVISCLPLPGNIFAPSVGYVPILQKNVICSTENFLIWKTPLYGRTASKARPNKKKMSEKLIKLRSVTSVHSEFKVWLTWKIHTPKCSPACLKLILTDSGSFCCAYYNSFKAPLSNHFMTVTSSVCVSISVH